MTALKKFFNIETGYHFEWGDLRTALTFINVLMVILFGVVGSWVGLGLAVLDGVKWFFSNRRINALLGAIAIAILNIYFIIILS